MFNNGKFKNIVADVDQGDHSVGPGASHHTTYKLMPKRGKYLFGCPSQESLVLSPLLSSSAVSLFVLPIDLHLDEELLLFGQLLWMYHSLISILLLLISSSCRQPV